jgi:hypothetical protein
MLLLLLLRAAGLSPRPIQQFHLYKYVHEHVACPHTVNFAGVCYKTDLLKCQFNML